MARPNIVVGHFKVTTNALTQGSTTVDTTNDTLTFTNHGLKTGDGVAFESSTTLPTGISADTKYFVIAVDKNTIAIATSAANATANTRVNITAAGTGTLTAYKNGFGATAISGIVPVGATITRAWTKMITQAVAVSGAGNATIAIACGGVALKAATAENDAAFTGTDEHSVTDAATSANTALTVTVAADTLSAGEYVVCVEYVPG